MYPLSMYMNGRAESERDFVKTKVNNNNIKSLPFLQEDAASNNGSENDITIASRDDDDPATIRI